MSTKNPAVDTSALRTAAVTATTLVTLPAIAGIPRHIPPGTCLTVAPGHVLDFCALLGSIFLMMIIFVTSVGYLRSL